MREQIEARAVKAIKDYVLEYPKPRLSARQKHRLKLDLKGRIEALCAINNIPPDKIKHRMLEVDIYANNLIASDDAEHIF